MFNIIISTFVLQYYLSGGVGVVYTVTVSGGGRGPGTICCQLRLQPSAHLTPRHHGSRAAGPPLLHRYKL